LFIRYASQFKFVGKLQGIEGNSGHCFSRYNSNALRLVRVWLDVKLRIRPKPDVTKQSPLEMFHTLPISATTYKNFQRGTHDANG
jgi:hypothetical protein